jgi:hypothetical protein
MSRIVINREHFEQLVKGVPVVIDGVDVLLSDIGFDAMHQLINDAGDRHMVIRVTANDAGGIKYFRCSEEGRDTVLEAYQALSAMRRGAKIVFAIHGHDASSHFENIEPFALTKI